MFEFCNDALKARIEDEIKNLTQEEVHEITKDALKEYLKNPDVIKDILFERSLYSYSTYNPSAALKSMIAKMVDGMNDEYLNTIANEFVEYLKNNYDKILRELIESSIAEKLRETIIQSDQFYQSIRLVIAKERNDNGDIR